MERMRYENLVKLTAAILPSKMSSKAKKHGSLEENRLTYDSLTWSDPHTG
jgi:hypothetical protein